MINWKNLEKFISAGKVVTLVIVVDGEEIGALSFNVDSLAYKEILESVSKPAAITIADKPATSTKAVTPKKKSEPEVMDDDEPEEDYDDEPEEDLAEPVNEVEKANQFIKKAEEIKTTSVQKPLTRESVLFDDTVKIGPAVPNVSPTMEPEPKKPTLLEDEW